VVEEGNAEPAQGVAQKRCEQGTDQADDQSLEQQESCDLNPAGAEIAQHR
jgi:hypothetical protein